METGHPNIAGKSAGEIARDVASFLARSCVMHGRQEADLAALLPDLNMKEQFSFALLMEAQQQGWEPAAAESFYRKVCGNAVDEQTCQAMISAFRDPNGTAFRSYREKYGCEFGLSSHSYWTACLAVAIDAKEIGKLMDYLRSFIFCVMEFAYMNDRNPSETYVWNYYESFQKILKELTEAPREPEPLKIRSLGGTAGKRENDCYDLSLGVDLQNPNGDHMAWNVQVDITLKDRDGNVITVISDQVTCIDPGAVFHYGITRKIRGAAVAHISAAAKAGSFTKLTTPIMKHAKVTKAALKAEGNGKRLTGTLVSKYDRPLRAYALHYQFLSRENKIVGGGCEWFFDQLPAGSEQTFTAACPVNIQNAVKIVYSVDFDARDLL